MWRTYFEHLPCHPAPVSLKLCISFQMRVGPHWWEQLLGRLFWGKMIRFFFLEGAACILAASLPSSFSVFTWPIRYSLGLDRLSHAAWPLVRVRVLVLSFGPELQPAGSGTKGRCCGAVAWAGAGPGPLGFSALAVVPSPPPGP